MNNTTTITAPVATAIPNIHHDIASGTQSFVGVIGSPEHRDNLNTLLATTQEGGMPDSIRRDCLRLLHTLAAIETNEGMDMVRAVIDAFADLLDGHSIASAENGDDTRSVNLSGYRLMFIGASAILEAGRSPAIQETVALVETIVEMMGFDACLEAIAGAGCDDPFMDDGDMALLDTQPAGQHRVGYAGAITPGVWLKHDGGVWRRVSAVHRLAGEDCEAVLVVMLAGGSIVGLDTGVVVEMVR